MQLLCRAADLVKVSQNLLQLGQSFTQVCVRNSLSDLIRPSSSMQVSARAAGGDSFEVESVQP
eukprot:4773889-Amphidinium_carterae.1